MGHDKTFVVACAGRDASPRADESCRHLAPVLEPVPGGAVAALPPHGAADLECPEHTLGNVPMGWKQRIHKQLGLAAAGGLAQRGVVAATKLERLTT